MKNEHQSMISYVCSEFDGIISLHDEEICGPYIQSMGSFELLIKKGSSVLCLLEVEKEDLEQGTTQCLVECEAVLTMINAMLFTV